MVKNSLFIRNLGRITYPRFLDIKSGILESEKINGDIKNTLLLVEHSSPLFTFPKKNTIEQPDAFSEAMLSLSSKTTSTSAFKSEFDSFKKFSKLGFDVCMVEKRNNGIICWHGPGQLTIYPMFSSQYKIDEIQYKSKLENVVQKSLKELNLSCSIRNDHIVINNNQIIGDIKIFDSQFKLPGISINVNTNFGEFNETKYLTSISKIINSSSISVSDIIPIVSNYFKKEFNFETIDDLYSYYVSQLESKNPLNPTNDPSSSPQQKHLFNSDNSSQKLNINPISF